MYSPPSGWLVSIEARRHHTGISNSREAVKHTQPSGFVWDLPPKSESSQPHLMRSREKLADRFPQACLLARMFLLLAASLGLFPSPALAPDRLLSQIAELVLRTRLRECGSCEVAVRAEPSEMCGVCDVCAMCES